MVRKNLSNGEEEKLFYENIRYCVQNAKYTVSVKKKVL